jgi:hypothetical protein
MMQNSYLMSENILLIVSVFGSTYPSEQPFSLD